MTVRGVEKIPDCLAAMIVANHSSYLDVFMLGIAFYGQLPKIRWVISKENYDLWYLRWFYAIFRVIPVTKGTTEKIREAMTEGCWIIMFPEGAKQWCSRRKRKQYRLRTGAAVIALSTGFPIIPVLIQGADKVLPPRSFRLNKRQPITVSIGQSFSYSPVKDALPDQDQLRKVTAEVMQHIRHAATPSLPLANNSGEALQPRVT
ncbi:MAG: 1-acyl-sn-glycerol-3-phosphate acyltransferase [Candidatus Omnitrophica bacterium]|nr:1-acyl-sn-glycerol-3-phosphate acyltransferase [Candidatus Omnitrophota bacterium]